MNELWADSIQKRFGEKEILKDIFLNLKTGKITCLLGRNGSGKTTLLEILHGSLNADQKFIRLNSKPINGLSGPTGIGYLPQGDLIPTQLKIKTAFKLYGCQKIPQLLQPFAHAKPGQLSGGELRLSEVLLLLYSNHTVVLLDEPFSGLSPIQKEELIQEMKSASKQKAILITDHDYRSLIQLADECILLHDGATKKITHSDELTRMGYLPY